jgi:hypothetical protein
VTWNPSGMLPLIFFLSFFRLYFWSVSLIPNWVY